ncbi:MAG: hypothetical protein LBO06_04585 [Bacteroidales bacterium]|jgi:hypothetical protein|nr:hypothetical protein [Bacteroidales bacterium]
MKKRVLIVALFGLALCYGCSKNDTATQESIKKNDWFHDGLKGKVKSTQDSYYGAFGSSQAAERGEFSTQTTTSYDTNGYRVTNDNSIQNHYNAAGLKDTIINLDDNGAMASKFINTYNNNDYVIQTMMYDHSGNPLYTWLYEYDSTDNVNEEALYNATGTKISHTRYLYDFDTNGNWIRKVIISVEEDEPLQIIERKIIYF